MTGHHSAPGKEKPAPLLQSAGQYRQPNDLREAKADKEIYHILLLF